MTAHPVDPSALLTFDHSAANEKILKDVTAALLCRKYLYHYIQTFAVSSHCIIIECMNKKNT